MSDFTPSMAGMQEAYHRWAIVSGNIVAPSELDAEFDRFMANVRADALRPMLELADALDSSANTFGEVVAWERKQAASMIRQRAGGATNE